MIFTVMRTLFIASLSFATSVSASDGVDKAVDEKLRAALKNTTMGLEVDTVAVSEIPGIYEVQFDRGPLVYATEDGKFFVVGDLYSAEGGEFVNLTEKRRDAERIELMASVAREDMIIFSPDGDVRAHVNVFTDITCGYCRKLHQEVPELNRRGVEVRYLAYPRSGLGTPGFAQLVTAWCSEDSATALTRLKNGDPVPAKSCADNPVAAQFDLGQALGVRGTPALVTQDGTLIPGYQSADQLMVTLGLE